MESPKTKTHGHPLSKNFSADSYSLSSYTMQGPKPIISRGSISNHTSFIQRRPRRLAERHHVVHASATKPTGTSQPLFSTSIIGTDKSLPVGLDGQFFVNAAEIMRWEGNRTETDAS
jgi:hypothetical protein